MFSRHSTPHLIFVLLATASLAMVQLTRQWPFGYLESATQDAFARMGTKTALDSRLVFLTRDTASASIETDSDLEQLLDIQSADADSSHALHLIAHEWPWPREIYALIINKLVKAGASAVVFDFNFPKPSPDDEIFRASLDSHKNRVVIAANIADDNLAGTLPVFCGPSTTLIPDSTPRDARVGYDNFWPDPDGVIRRAHYRWSVEYGVWQSDECLSLTACAARQAGLGNMIPSGRSPYRIRFAGRSGTFAPHSIFEIFVPKYWHQNYLDGGFFKNKIVVLGASGNWQHDQHLTPMGVMAGAELHLNALNALLKNGFASDLPPIGEGFLVCVASFAAGVVRWKVRRPYFRFIWLFAGTALWLVLAFEVFNHLNIFVTSVCPLAAFNLHGISGLFVDVMTERREKTHLRRTLERYVSRNVVAELIDHPEQLGRALGGELRDVTVLFSDIRNFSHLTNILKTEELVVQINEYFTAMVECVFQFHGSLDKFVGDALMAVWGNVRRCDPATDARNAVLCAAAMNDKLTLLNEKWEKEGKPLLRIGIGINSGEVIVGNIGSLSRMEFTVIGDAVNVAWRLQEHTKRLGVQLLLGDRTMGLLGEEFPVVRLGEISINENLRIHAGTPFTASAVIACTDTPVEEASAFASSVVETAWEKIRREKSAVAAQPKSRLS